jgi:hypothetical protein
LGNADENKARVALEPVAKDGARALDELKAGNLIIARSRDDFLYISDRGGMFHMFSHTVGAPGGGQREFPKNEKYNATVRKVVELADSVFRAEFDRDMNLYGVLATAEEAILSMYPSSPDNDAQVEFAPWDREKSALEADKAEAEAAQSDEWRETME